MIPPRLVDLVGCKQIEDRGKFTAQWYELYPLTSSFAMLRKREASGVRSDQVWCWGRGLGENIQK